MTILGFCVGMSESRIIRELFDMGESNTTKSTTK